MAIKFDSFTGENTGNSGWENNYQNFSAFFLAAIVRSDLKWSTQGDFPQVENWL